MSQAAPIRWPENKRFAFTVFDDPDSQTLEESRLVYGLLGDLGFRTTKGVWAVGPYRVGNSKSETCENPLYREHGQSLQRQGFEIGFHNASLRTSSREITEKAFETFREYFGAYPSVMSNHFDNSEGIYWGSARLSGLRRWVYKAATRNGKSHYSGHVEGDPLFWGDLCRNHIRYCRNFVFRNINTLAACPQMPYYDPARPYVQAWYASSEGADATSFLETISEANQDRLESEGGACIMYTHFGKGFVQDGKVTQRFRELLTRLSRKNGWFVPVSVLLDCIRQQRGDRTLSAQERARLEWSWLTAKLIRGTA